MASSISPSQVGPVQQPDAQQRPTSTSSIAQTEGNWVCPLAGPLPDPTQTERVFWLAVRIFSLI